MAKLLFVNTFCHDNVEDFNIDFVKFSSGALATVREIRIIPGGARIPVAEAPQRQGLTAPNSFNLEVFAKNSKRADTSVFERIALFEYHFDSDIRFQIPAYTTDGILFKGKYTALSVAIYGDPVSGDPSVDTAQASMTSAIPTLGGINPNAAALPSPATLQPPSSATAFVPSPSDAGPGLLTAAATVVFPSPPTQILTVGAPIPTWVGPPAAVPPVLHMAPPPPTFNPLVPPPLSVIPPYPTGAPNAGAPGAVVDYRISPHATAGVVVHVPFDPTRPPPSFHTPQHSPQLVPPQISPSEKRAPPVQGPSRRLHEPASKIKRYDSNEPTKIQPLEGKPIETISTVKPVVSSVSPANMQSMRSGTGLTAEEIQLEEGEYAGSEGDNSEKFDLENISEEEFEFDDAMAAQVNDTELQEDLLANVRFNPYKFTLAPLKYFKDPSLSQYQIEWLNFKRRAREVAQS